MKKMTQKDVAANKQSDPITVPAEPSSMNSAEEGQEMSLAYRIFSIVRSVLVFVLAAAIIFAALFFAADRSPNKSMFGYRYYTVLTNSMVPEFSSGDMVFVKVCGADTIAVNDIITFNPSSSSDAYLTHRVTEKIDDYQGTGVTCFKTKGDANNSEDSFLIDESRVIGKVKFHVPKLGLIVRFIQLRWYFVIPIIVMLFVFFRLLRKYFEMQSEKTDDGKSVDTASKIVQQNDLSKNES